MDKTEVDVIVVGAGPAGEVAAGRLAGAGRKVVLVEEELVGGECSFYACMPSKALLRPGQALAEARRVQGASQAITGELDVGAVLARRDEIIHDLDDSAQTPWLRDRGITLIRGHGVLDGKRTVRVGEDVVHARDAVVLAPGSTATIPPIAGLEEAGGWTNREVTTAKVIPRSLVILGGGAVGVEMAQAYTYLGARVTLIEAVDRLLANEEPFASEQVSEALIEAGAEIVLGVEATAVAREAKGSVTVTVAGGHTFTGDELLVAVGRSAATENLGLESIGLQGGGPIEVRDTMVVPGVEWLYVIGDANGRVLLTHMGKYQARVAADHILGRQGATPKATGEGPLSPRVVFTEPQVAAVGHTLSSAEQAGIRARAVDQPTSANAGSTFIGHETAGTCRIVVDEDRGVIVGATFTGAAVAESLHAATIAIVGEVSLERLFHAVPSFPTRSEVWLKLLEEYGL